MAPGKRKLERQNGNLPPATNPGGGVLLPDWKAKSPPFRKGRGGAKGGNSAGP